MASEWDFQVLQHPVLPNYSAETGGLEELVAPKQCSGEAEHGPEAGAAPGPEYGVEHGCGAEQKDAPGPGGKQRGCLGLKCGPCDCVPASHLVDPAEIWTHSAPAPTPVLIPVSAQL